MTRRIWIAGAMAAAVALSLITAVPAVTHDQPDKGDRRQRGAALPARRAVGMKPVASVKQLMIALVIPASDAVFKAASETPADEQAWAAVEASAVALAESGNLLMLGSRARDAGDWMKMSRAMLDAAETALKAAQAKQADGLAAAGDRIYETCEACHTKYWRRGSGAGRWGPAIQ